MNTDSGKADLALMGLLLFVSLFGVWEGHHLLSEFTHEEELISVPFELGSHQYDLRREGQCIGQIKVKSKRNLNTHISVSGKTLLNGTFYTLSGSAEFNPLSQLRFLNLQLQNTKEVSSIDIHGVHPVTISLRKEAGDFTQLQQSTYPGPVTLVLESEKQTFLQGSALDQIPSLREYLHDLTFVSSDSTNSTEERLCPALNQIRSNA